MRISDWSSDVCSSDLTAAAPPTGCRRPGSLQRSRPKRRGARDCGQSALSDAAPPSTAGGLRPWWKASAPYAPHADRGSAALAPAGAAAFRSEEHTSELQSLMRISYAVFCLKKKHTNQHNTQQ